MDGRGNPSKEEPEQEGLGSSRPAPVAAAGRCPEGPAVWLGQHRHGLAGLEEQRHRWFEQTAGSRGETWEGCGVP